MFPIDEHLRVDAKAAEALGKQFASQYQSAHPFPHICIDNFLPASLAEEMLRQFPRPEAPATSFDRAQERRKRTFLPEQMADFPRQMFYTFNSLPFVKFVEALTGIKGVIPDPYFLGGGFHETTNGGHLDIHADFNFHQALALERRVNVLIYLNHGWRREFGGQFEIWDEQMQKKLADFEPVFNRCVVFNTSSTSYHGNPVPVAHPEGMPRRSIALYYYTATWDGTSRKHTTQFRRRPGTNDVRDYRVVASEMIKDLMPPVLHRVALKIGRRLTGRSAGRA